MIECDDLTLENVNCFIVSRPAQTGTVPPMIRQVNAYLSQGLRQLMVTQLNCHNFRLNCSGIVLG
jgi:hypothetical protein